MLTKFYIRVSSATEFAAIKAALATKGIQVEKIVERLLKDYYNSKTDIGNYSSGGDAQKEIIYVGGYGGSKEGRCINGIAELIPFLESGEYKQKEKTYVVYVREIRVVPVEIQADSLTQAQEKVRGGSGKFLNEKMTHSDLIADEHFDIFGEKEGHVKR